MFCITRFWCGHLVLQLSQKQLVIEETLYECQMAVAPSSVDHTSSKHPYFELMGTNIWHKVFFLF